MGGGGSWLGEFFGFFWGELGWADSGRGQSVVEKYACWDDGESDGVSEKSAGSERGMYPGPLRSYISLLISPLYVTDSPPRLRKTSPTNPPAPHHLRPIPPPSPVLAKSPPSRWAKVEARRGR